jgi:hypothetical protein
MTKVEIAIGKLLFDHDCVVIPGFGGLLANYVGAEIHPITNALKPPRKKIAFNEGLQLNDGLLQNYLVLEGEVSHKDALKEISEYVHLLNDEIKNNGVYLLEGTGSFLRNEENKIQFEASEEVNFLDDSFGLPELYYKPIQREQENMKQVQPTQGRPVRRAPVKKDSESTELSKEEGKKKGKGVFIAIPSILVVLAVSIFLFTKKSDNRVQEASFVSDSIETVEENSIVDEATDYIEEDDEHDGAFMEEEHIDGDLATQFYIIAGVFSTEENAHKFTVLYHQGEVIHDGDYYRVSLGKFSTKDDAKLHIEDFRNNYGDKIWILEHK